MEKSKIFLASLISFIFGIFFSSYLKVSQSILFFFFILAIVFIFLSLKYKRILIFGFLILIFSFSVLRFQLAFLKIENNPIKNFFDKEISLIGIITEEPKITKKSAKLVISPKEIEGKSDKNFGKILVFTRKFPEYEYGEKLKIKGVLKEPKNFDNFDYKNYLAKDGILALIYFPDIELEKENFGNPIKRFLLNFKKKLKSSLNNFLSPPQSGLMEALLFGDEEKISDQWKEKFNLTGVRHITAVSGMNTTIIAFLILNFLLALGFWRKHALYLSIILIFFYVIMIGAPASAIRAAIMASLLLISQIFGKLSDASREILFAAALMLFFNPLLLRYDIGFQLSFLATLGLIYLQPIFENSFKKFPQFLSLRSNLSATLGAQIFTLPILIYNFGRIPLISPFSNILILPFLPFLTILGFFLSLFGIFFWPIGFLLSLFCWFFLTFILKVVDLSSKIPFASISIQRFSFLIVLFSYFLLAIFIWKLKEREKLKFLGIL